MNVNFYCGVVGDSSTVDAVFVEAFADTPRSRLFGLLGNDYKERSLQVREEMVH